MKRTVLLMSLVGVAAMATAVPAAQYVAPRPKPDKELIERGRYLALSAGCNDCHTPDWIENEGKVPESAWLTGSAVGYSGIWGTTYATNLRRNLARMTEANWLKYAKVLETRPPMPWYNLNQWTDQDLRALYHFVRHLGAAGRPAPDAVPPHEEPKTAVILWPIPPPAPPVPGSAAGPGRPGQPPWENGNGNGNGGKK